MSLIKSLMGRRQFLAAAGMGSASALALGKLGGAIDPVFQTHAAIAAERAGAVDLNAVSYRYSHILSPLKIGNVVLKNRFMHPQSIPHFLQGPENFPSDEMRSYYINLAKNGAGIISVRIMSNRVRKDLKGDSAHMVIYDIEDYGVQNYLEQLVEGIHIYGSKACAGIQVGMGMGALPGAAAAVAGAAAGQGAPAAAPGAMGAQASMSAEQVQKMVESAVTQAKFYASHGFDAAQLGIRGNQSVTIELCKAVKKAVPDMLTITELFVREPSITQHTEDNYYKSGTTIDDAVKNAKQLEGAADIVMVRIGDSSAAHATTWNSIRRKPYTINYAEAIKKSGAKIITAPGSGYQNLDDIEEYIKSGKTDMVTIARAFICDSEYAKKMSAGRGEDVVPCIRCNKCHGENMMEGPWYTVCSVNPKVGIPLAVKSIQAPGAPKKVAVIGGGPAGLKAAITAAERGHKVTLYEKGSSLGGLLRHSDYSSYKWAIKDFKDYLIKRIDELGVTVILNTSATAEMIKAKGYDTILVAVGSDPIVSKIPGADGSNVYNIIDSYSKEKSMGKNIVFIGGGEFGADAGMHLAKTGHNVTMLTSEKELFPNDRPHYPITIIEAYQDLKNFSIITEGTATGISAGKVTYKDTAGSEKSIPADSVVVYSGLKPKKDESLKFYGSAKQFFTVGDCSEKGGNIQKCIRSAFFTASEV
jgi:2,4-dienoyl-CoA reductase-like NADH-dependent reductase (Old Yellow Enzyme family)/thioredoxin reductase